MFIQRGYRLRGIGVICDFFKDSAVAQSAVLICFFEDRSIRAEGENGGEACVGGIPNGAGIDCLEGPLPACKIAATALLPVGGGIYNAIVNIDVSIRPG